MDRYCKEEAALRLQLVCQISAAQRMLKTLDSETPALIAGQIDDTHNVRVQEAAKKFLGVLMRTKET